VNLDEVILLLGEEGFSSRDLYLELLQLLELLGVLLHQFILDLEGLLLKERFEVLEEVFEVTDVILKLLFDGNEEVLFLVEGHKPLRLQIRGGLERLKLMDDLLMILSHLQVQAMDAFLHLC